MNRPQPQTLYKLTDEHMCTRGGYPWALGRRRTIPAKARRPDAPLCSSSYLHAYLTPDLARLLNPIHANFRAPRLFEAAGAATHAHIIAAAERAMRDTPLEVLAWLEGQS